MFKEGLLRYMISSPSEILQQEFQASSMSWLSRRLAACPTYKKQTLLHLNH
jgi:hypothetical protein